MSALADFTSYPLWVNIVVFAIASATVWFAGTRLASYADDISIRTGLGYVLIGMLLLGGITSLPEIAVAVSAGISGNAPLAVNNLIGGVALQVVIIVIGDAVLRKRPLTYAITKPSVLLQGAFCCMLLCLLIAGIALGDTPFLGVGFWSMAIFFGAIALLWLVSTYRDDQAWRPAESLELDQEEERHGEARELRTAIVLTLAAALGIFVAGYLLTKTGEAIAEQTGLGSSFVGAIFVAFATSLPEISTVIAAVRLKRYVMAFSDIFGTNIIDIALVLIVDLSYAGPPVLNEVAEFFIVGAALATLLTLIYMAGLIERRDRQVAGLGIDSWAVMVVYLIGVSFLYTLR